MSATTSQLLDLIELCLKDTFDNYREWAELGIQHKQLEGPAAEAEELLAGPAAMMRGLALLRATFRSLVARGTVHLPGRITKDFDGRTLVPLMPVNAIYDSAVFQGMSCVARMEEGIGQNEIHGDRVSSILHPAGIKPNIVLVLGAGNVSSIAAADALSKIFLERKAVLLKFNPVNSYLRPVYERSFRSLISAGFLQLVEGDGEIGKQLINDPGVDEVHITGSHHTHDAIVWGATVEARKSNKAENKPVLNKPITSELGNVSPWIVVPGNYSQKQLKSQATHLAASIINNASFNCVATKMIVTSRNWPQREQFLSLLDEILAGAPPRVAYYPGAQDRFKQFSNDTPLSENRLPWSVVKDLSPTESPDHFSDESFVCVCGETSIPANSAEDFLANSVEFCNSELFGTLSASITLPPYYERQNEQTLNQALAGLRYGSIGINQWAGLVYAMMSPPWGGFPGATLQDPQSGIGTVHNTLLLSNVEKSILRGPLCSFPKPLWFPTHRTALPVAHSLIKLYANPNLLNLSRLGWFAAWG